MIPSGTPTEEDKAPTAPEISNGLWINSEPLTLKSLQGRVVLIEFWTFACYNCRNTVPSVKSGTRSFALLLAQASTHSLRCVQINQTSAG